MSVQMVFGTNTPFGVLNDTLASHTGRPFIASCHRFTDIAMAHPPDSILTERLNSISSGWVQA